jgi:hypothetical protein
MNCLSLFDRPIADYIADFRKRNDRLFVFQHVPKTAGSSIHAELERIENGFHWCGDDTPQNSWDAFMLLHDRMPFRLLRGHMNSMHLSKLTEAGIRYQAVGFMRCPIQQTISHFRYCHSEVCPDHEDMRARYPEIGSFISEYLKPNFTTCYMVGACDSADEAIDRITERFDFVGLTEFYNTSMFLLMACLGREYRVRPRVNVTKSNRSVDDLLTDQVRDQIDRDFAIDIQVHRYFSEQFTMVSERVVEYMCREESEVPVC